MAATVPLVLDVSAVIEPAPDGPVVALVVNGQVVDRKPLREYLACPVCGHATNANRGGNAPCSS
ncbi:MULTISPECIES: hypothetical protein [Mycolicibacterium]|uniref:Uncharacterized protein n=1 Tax=Mycobacterium phage Bipper TaxID=1805457 RepID=A0A142F2Q6_9CAUD|nr:MULTISPECIES: hypothetical protein [Mycolicibacterium]YP_009303275.1 hypothetical protein KCH39_gp049 [Mycobacterium phage Bipper]QDF19415.1 hypothetical protein SEA_CRACKLEWINK_129 [Mycobacterium phage Cracklewink]AMQ67063.1 hypothetical protein SEA_BIPPER_128 [Mycobacterium phage Bipper]MCC9181103.1 hypothetical protein [Mycolicibacterium mageritense]UBV14819.1 hypothetical protein H8Z57_29680 [Mycolicibacterium fortuitum]